VGNKKNSIEFLLNRASSANASDQELMNLLHYFQAGLGLEHLVGLLRSDNPRSVRYGAWILSELGQRGRELLDEAENLLTHTDKSVRFDAIDSILANASTDDGRVIAKCVALLLDPETSVQWKCLNFIRRIGKAHLEAAEKCADEEWIRQNLRWLINQLNVPDDTAIAARAQSNVFTDRAFSCVAIAAMKTRYTHILKSLADPSGDAVGRFSADALEDLTLSTSGSRN